jgi:ribosomal protein L7Ae-like RNA K-turn-binding protein
MKELKKAEQPLMVEPQLEELKKGRKSEILAGEKNGDPSSIQSAGVRILSHANPYQNRTNLEEDQCMNSADKSHKSCEKVRSEESSLNAAIDAPEFVPSMSIDDRKCCDTCGVHFNSVSQWASHITSRSHQRKVMHFASQELCEENQNSRDALPISKLGELKIRPKTYVGRTDDLEEYVDQIITEDINSLAQNFLSRLIAWQERIKQTDPKNAKRKRRLVAGIREASKFAKIGKLILVIVAPNIQPLITSSSDSPSPKYPIDDLLATCRKSGVPIVFALSRKKMGKLLGQRKSVSLFAVLDASGAEQDLHMLVQTAEKSSCQFRSYTAP